jgi:hypothetical protein
MPAETEKTPSTIDDYLATTPADFRFLAHRAPLSLLQGLRDRAPTADIRATVERIAAVRGWTG